MEIKTIFAKILSVLKSYKFATGFCLFMLIYVIWAAISIPASYKETGATRSVAQKFDAENNKKYRQGGDNDGMRFFLKKKATKERLDCEIEVDNETSGKRDKMHLTTNYGWTEMDLTNAFIDGGYKDLRKQNGNYYFWDPKYNFSEPEGDEVGSYITEGTIEALWLESKLDFSNANPDKSVFKCTIPKRYESALILPSINWVYYNGK